MSIRIKCIYEAAEQEDGTRILVDRLWPRGLSMADAKLDDWAKQIAPSNELRRWYAHDPTKWAEFKRRYFEELDANPDGVAELLGQMSGRCVTFLFSSKESQRNNATALKEYVDSRR